jgi:large subunit ribosomal protein L17
MLRNLATSLVEHEHVRTTDAKAKELRRVADRLITLAKKGTLDARRRAAAYIRTQKAVKKLFGDVAERFKERPGGYTRIIKLGTRHGDAAKMSMIELTDRGETAKAEADKKRERRARRTKKRDEGGGGRPGSAGPINP